MIEEMKYVNIIGYTKDIERIIEQYISRYDIQLEYAIKDLGDVAKNFDTANPYANLARKAENILKFNNATTNLLITKDEAIEIIQTSSEVYSKKTAELQRLELLRSNLLELLSNIHHFNMFEFDFAELERFEFIKYRFGYMPLSNYKQFQTFLYDDPNILFVEGEIVHDYIWGVYFTHDLADKAVDELFAKFNFEIINLPFEFELNKLNGTIANIARDLNLKLADIDTKIDSLKNISDNALEASAVNKIIDLQFYHDTRKFGAVILNDFFIFTGWMSARNANALDFEMETDDSVILATETNRQKFPPTILSNFAIFKPFELFVKMYGVPAYNEIDPTPFLAITYTILFGLMFGDVGQGFVLFTLGFLNRRKHDLFAILSTLGLSSIAFGVLYGSCFGFEYNPIWIKPVDNINFILLFTIFSGIFLIFMSMIFNLINSLRSDNLIKLFFSPNGMAGLIFYASVLTLISVSYFKLGGAFVFLTTALLSLLLMAFQKPISNLLNRDEKSHHGNVFVTVFEVLVELFEILLGYFTNTISFVRVGAFALSHAGMMSVVMLLAKSTHGTNWFIVALGNLLVIAMEGLIVGIQVLRLEFYEMFGRFFSGNGKEYTPYKTLKK